MAPVINIAGQRFGRLVVLGREGRDKRNQATWRCQCDCGGTLIANTRALRSGNTRSCGCLHKEITRARLLTHGEGRTWAITPEYRSWRSMITRCYNSNLPSYKNYGARGISVCGRWRNSYEAFLQDMGRRPTLKHTLDRIDNDGNYEPSNCRWATRTGQVRNRRDTRRVVVNGISLSLAQACEERGLPYDTVHDRLERGWSVERALLAWRDAP